MPTLVLGYYQNYQTYWTHCVTEIIGIYKLPIDCEAYFLMLLLVRESGFIVFFGPI